MAKARGENHREGPSRDGARQRGRAWCAAAAVMLLAPAYVSAGPVNEEGVPLQLDVAPTPTVATIAPAGRDDEGGTAAGRPGRSSSPSTTTGPQDGVGMLDPLVVLGPLAGLSVVVGGTALVRVARATRANHDPRGAVDARS